MDPDVNPYSMGAGNPPPALTGREAQEQQFRTLLARLGGGLSDRSMIVSGLRGVGKTVLLLEFEEIAKDAGWTTSRPIEIKSDTDFRAELADAAYQALLQLSTRKALGDRLRSFTGLLRGFKVGASSDGSVEFSFGPDAVNGSTGNLERDLTNLFEELGQTARGTRRASCSWSTSCSSWRAGSWRPWRPQCAGCRRRACPWRWWAPAFHSCRA